MPEIQPFDGYYYNTEIAGTVDRLIAPPYDVIDTRYEEKLAGSSPYNIVHLTLPHGGGVYDKVSKVLDKWIDGQILIRDAAPHYYFLTQDFQHEGATKKRTGFFCRVGLKNVAGIVRHETTFEKYVSDRSGLLAATKTNLEPIFMLYEDNDFLLEKAADKEKPFLSARLEKVKNGFGRLGQSEEFRALEEKIRQGPLLIADGHHRFAASLKTYAANPAAAPAYVMTYVTNLSAPDLLILPTHRLVSLDFEWRTLMAKVTPYFTVQRCGDLAAFMQTLRKSGPHSFGVFGAGRFYVWTLIHIGEIEKFLPGNCSPECRELDVVILHRFIFKEILKMPPDTAVFYDRDETVIHKKAETDAKQLAFFLKPVDIDDVKTISLKGEMLPQKTTYFYPKVPSGFVISKYE